MLVDYSPVRAEAWVYADKGIAIDIRSVGQVGFADPMEHSRSN